EILIRAQYHTRPHDQGLRFLIYYPLWSYNVFDSKMDIYLRSLVLFSPLHYYLHRVMESKFHLTYSNPIGQLRVGFYSGNTHLYRSMKNKCPARIYLKMRKVHNLKSLLKSTYYQYS